MKKTVMYFIIIGFVLILNLNTFAAETPKKIKAGYFKLDPHIMNIPGTKKPIGATFDLWNNYLAKELNIEIEWFGELPMLRLQEMLEKGDLDIVVLLAKNDERAKKFLYPKKEYTSMRAGIAVLKSSGIKEINEPADLYGLKIGYFGGGYLSPFMRDKNFKIEYVLTEDWLELNYRKLKAKRIDAFYEAEILTIKYQFKNLGDYDLFNFIELPEESQPLYSVFSKKNSVLMAKYEAALEKVLKKTSYKLLLEKYVK